MDELHHRGVGQAYLYGDKATENYSKLHSFYLLLDRPSVCGLPDEPFNPWLNMAGDYARSMTGGLVAIAMLVVVLILSRL